MDSDQIQILNSLVTFAAENVPGGLNDQEGEVARIIGGWALFGTLRTYNYIVVNSVGYDDIAKTCNIAADRGWSVVGIVRGPADLMHIVLQRPVGVSHPDD